MTHEFRAWPKTPRLFRDIVITEKLDGTNAAVAITELGEGEFYDGPDPLVFVGDGVHAYVVSAQSRKRIITPHDDNFGFARWVHGNAAQLVALLGEGLHFGEWWGNGIQRGYGMSCKHFALFNTERHADTFAMVGDSMVQPVPVLYAGRFGAGAIEFYLRHLGNEGSVASPGFMNPEGICVFHTASRQVFKVTLDADDVGKWGA
jgi:hypothetical protein